jgi:sugar phosphate isomerase/epimerase
MDVVTPARTTDDHPDPKRRAFRVGSAPDSWGVWFPDDPRQTPWDRFLDEISRAGYEWVELGPYGYLPTDPETLRPQPERRGLRLAAGTPTLDDDRWQALVRGAEHLARVLRDETGLCVLPADTCVIVEHDLYPCDFDRPYPIAARRRETLRAAGVG